MNTNDKVKSSIFSIAKSDHQYDFLSLLQNMVYTYEPDSNINKAGNTFFSNTRQSLKENSVPIFQLNNREDYDYVVNDILKFDHEHGLSKNNKDLFESIYSKFSNRDYIKELFLDGIKDNFGMDNIQEGGLFWLEETENGLDAIFAHIDDISRLKGDEKKEFLDRVITNKKEKSKSYREEQIDTPIFKFADFNISRDDIKNKSFEELNSITSAILEHKKMIYNSTETKLSIKYDGSYKILINFTNQEIKLYPKDKALYFLILLYPKGINFTDLKYHTNSLKRFLGKLKSHTEEDKQRKINNLVEKSEILSPTKSNTNKKIVKTVNSAYPNDLSFSKVISDELTYVTGDPIEIPVNRYSVSGLGIINKLLNKPYDIKNKFNDANHLLK